MIDNQKREPLIAQVKQGMPLQERRLVSNSSRNGFTFCPRSFQLGQVVGLRRRQSPLPLTAGSMIHRCLELYYSGSNLPAIIDVIEDWRKEQIKLLASLSEPQYDEARINETAAVADDVIARYITTYGYDDRQRYEVLAIEAPFVVPMPQPYKGGFRVDPDYAYTGVFDLVLRDTHSGNVVVMDHKTTAFGDLLDFERDVNTMGNGQRVGYIYAARFFWPGASTLVYNVLRKRIPSRPGTVQCRRCKGKGEKDGVTCNWCSGLGKAGLSKTVPDTTPTEFVTQVADLKACNPDFDDGLAADHLAAIRKKGARYLYRFGLGVPDDEVTRWCTDIYEIARAMGRGIKYDRWPRNLGACSVNGRRCTFLPVCHHGWEGNDNFELAQRHPFRPHEAVVDDVDTVPF
jgi:hypothetical protein